MLLKGILIECSFELKRKTAEETWMLGKGAWGNENERSTRWCA